MARLSGLMLTLLLIVGATGLLSAPAMAMDTMESSALERGEHSSATVEWALAVFAGNSRFET